MLAGVADSSLTYILCGVIWSLALGFAAGNYACSLVHRLPRKKPLLDKTPYCGSCGALLKVKDLFPVASALLLKHRCRYCGAPFPTSHTWTELSVGALFVLAFLRYDFSEAYILIVLLGVFLITLAAVEANEKIIMPSVLVCAALAGVVLRTWADHSIYGFFAGGLFGLIAGLALHYRQIRKVGHVYVPPPQALLPAAGGLIAGAQDFFPFLAAYAALYLVSRLFKNIPLTVPFGLAAMATAMYPAAL